MKHANKDNQTLLAALKATVAGYVIDIITIWLYPCLHSKSSTSPNASIILPVHVNEGHRKSELLTNLASGISNIIEVEGHCIRSVQQIIEIDREVSLTLDCDLKRYRSACKLNTYRHTL